MTPIGNMIATLDGFKPLNEVLDVYHKAIELEKENARLRELLKEIVEVVPQSEYNYYLNKIKQGKEEWTN
jgi:hypothetical protein